MSSDDEDDECGVVPERAASCATVSATTRRSSSGSKGGGGDSNGGSSSRRETQIRQLLAEHGWTEEDQTRLETEGYIFVIPSDESLMSETARRRAELARKRCISSDAIRVPNMGRLGLVKHTLSRTIDPYTETIPTVQDFIASKKSLRTARALYPNEYGTWAKLLDRGFRLEHFTRDKWWDVSALVETYRVDWEMLRRDVSLTAKHLLEQKATCSELVQLRIDTKALVEMGMDKATFMSFPYELLADWKKTLHLTKEHMLNDLNMFAEDFEWLIRYHNWSIQTLHMNLYMSMTEINRRSTYSAPPIPHAHTVAPTHQQQQQQQQHYARVYPDPTVYHYSAQQAPLPPQHHVAVMHSGGGDGGVVVDASFPKVIGATSHATVYDLQL